MSLELKAQSTDEIALTPEEDAQIVAEVNKEMENFSLPPPPAAQQAPQPEDAGTAAESTSAPIPKETEGIQGEGQDKKGDSDSPKQDAGPDPRIATMLGADEIEKDTTVYVADVDGVTKKEIVITARDKSDFLDSVLSNTRYKKRYDLFGGKSGLVLRCMTVDEMQAFLTRRYNLLLEDSLAISKFKHLPFQCAVMVEEFNGKTFDELAKPYVEHIDSKGKTIKPGWTEQEAYWSGMQPGVLDVISKCIADFSERYAAMMEAAKHTDF